MVYLFKAPGIARFAPKDAEYFARLQQLGQKYTNQRVYNDYVEIYNRTNAILDPGILDFITKITSAYGSDSLEMDVLLTIIYAGMVAEENKAKANTKEKNQAAGDVPVADRKCTCCLRGQL